MSTESLGGVAMAADGQGCNRIRAWRRSSQCSPVGNCVEISRTRGGTFVRDSKSDAELPALEETQWMALMGFCRSSG